MKSTIAVIIFSLILGSATAQKTRTIDLAGVWSVQLDSLDRGETENWQNRKFHQQISLPGTTDQARMGVENTLKPELKRPQLSHLTRKFSYIGAAWYTREVDVPSDWKGGNVELELERVIWKTSVWVNGTKVPVSEHSLITPHRYEISKYLKTGQKNTLMICVDNRKQYDISVDDMAHAYTDHTQIKWNGILGKIELNFIPQVAIGQVRTYPDNDNKLKVKLYIDNTTGRKQAGMVELTVVDKRTGKVAGSYTAKAEFTPGSATSDFELNSLKDIQKWNEFNPSLYTLTAKVSYKGNNSEKSVDFGFRTIAKEKNRMLLNGKPMYLRGSLDCGVFPLTGTPPTDVEGWMIWLKTAKEWGLNHLRFHSWCPPKAAFEAADILGMYFQVELPVWSLNIGKEEKVTQYLNDEAARLFKEYGNHPSFCLFSIGNELQSDFTVLQSILANARQNDTRQLFTTTSYTFERGHGTWPEPDDDFFITQRTKQGWVRGQGVFNQFAPSFDKAYDTSVEGMQVPLVTHEIGQYSVYPDISEIGEYTGVLTPLNFMAVRDDLIRKGLIDKAQDYLMGSGKLAVILYKEEIERAIKTHGVSGIQLLNLTDFPGQGTALVGLLNAFARSKGLIRAEEFREFCAPVVPLLRFPKATYTNNETFEADVEVANYSFAELAVKQINWSIEKQNGEVVTSGTINIDNIKEAYNASLGRISIPLSAVKEASQLTLRLRLPGTEYRNHWQIWVYPAEPKMEFGEVKYTRDMTEAMKWLEQGHKVLLNPSKENINGIEGKFVPVFWSPVHFPDQAGTMGVLCDPAHPALSDFPTDSHTNWQWWDLNINSTTMLIDNLHGGSSIVEMIDNFTKNRKLSLMFEGSVGTGKLVVASFDLNKDLATRPVARQMLISVLKYMNGNSFNPAKIENPDFLGSLEKKIIE